MQLGSSTVLAAAAFGLLCECSSSSASPTHGDDASDAAEDAATDTSHPDAARTIDSGSDAADSAACDAAGPDLDTFDGGRYPGCIPYLREHSPAVLAACQAECGCASFLEYCLGPSSVYVGATGCLSPAQTPAISALFYATVETAPCANYVDAGLLDADASDPQVIDAEVSDAPHSLDGGCE